MLLIWLFFTLGAIIATSSTNDIESSDKERDLESAESNDARKLEIIKQIRPINGDGTFLVAYEANDGPFKIESRDVLGNGYVDESGKIKRVSYTVNDRTSGLESSTSIPVYISPEYTTQKTLSTDYPRGSKSRRITLIATKRLQYSTTAPTVKNLYKNTNTKSEPTTKTIVYAKSIHSTMATPSSMSKSFLPISGSKIRDRFSKVLNMNANINEPNVEVNKSVIRRQLSDSRIGNYESNYRHSSDEDPVQTYTDLDGTQRSILATTSSPRIPANVLAARNRAALLKNVAIQSTSLTENRSNIKNSRNKGESSIADDEYLKQSQVALKISANNAVLQKDNDHPPNTYPPKVGEYLSRSQSSNVLENDNGQYRLPVKTNFVQRDIGREQYLRETSTSNPKDPTFGQYENSHVNAPTHPSILQSLGQHISFRSGYDRRIHQVTS